MLTKILLFSLLVVASTEIVRYDNYSLFKVNPQNVEGLKYLKKLYKEPGDLIFWNGPNNIGDDVSVVIPPELRKEVEEELTQKNAVVEVMHQNLQEVFDAEKRTRRKRSAGRELYWDSYQTLEDIYGYLQELADNNAFVTLFHTGTTFEGRNITGIRIARGSGRPTFVLTGGEIGADWLSPVIVTYIANELVKGEDPEALAASQDFEWHIIPFVNPDGFEYSQNRDRLWMKNRRIDIRNPTGVDITKNWNYEWGRQGGSFVNTAANFVGLGPFSEVESRSVSGYIQSITPRVSGLLSFRLFGQRLLLPFADSSAQIYNYNEMIIIGRRAMGSLAVKYNTQYIVGTSFVVSDGATGTIGDWIKARMNPPVVATYLLRGSTFIMPDSQVLPSCEETYDSVMAIIREAKFIDVL